MWLCSKIQSYGAFVEMSQMLCVPYGYNNPALVLNCREKWLDGTIF